MIRPQREAAQVLTRSEVRAARRTVGRSMLPGIVGSVAIAAAIIWRGQLTTPQFVVVVCVFYLAHGMAALLTVSTVPWRIANWVGPRVSALTGKTWTPLGDPPADGLDASDVLLWTSCWPLLLFTDTLDNRFDD